MASQLVSDVSCQKLMHCAASYGERGSGCTLSHRPSYGYHRIGNSIGIHPEGNFKEHSEKGSSKRSTNQTRQQAQKLHSEARMGIEAPMAEPYFSVPVLPN